MGRNAPAAASSAATPSTSGIRRLRFRYRPPDRRPAGDLDLAPGLIDKFVCSLEPRLEGAVAHEPCIARPLGIYQNAVGEAIELHVPTWYTDPAGRPVIRS